jgi:hypothetical protein
MRIMRMVMMDEWDGVNGASCKESTEKIEIVHETTRARARTTCKR